MSELESIRTRLLQVNHSLDLLKNQISAPSSSSFSLASQFSVLSSQLGSLISSIQSSSLEPIVINPTTSFPVENEAILSTLLRKKLLPDVEEAWSDLEGVESDGRWANASTKVQECINERKWDGKMTLEEINAGEEEEDGYEAVNISQQSLNDTLQFIHRGIIPEDTGKIV